MISGLGQSSLGILIILVEDNEYQSEFIKNGPTREHSILLWWFGIKNLMILINKMDLNNFKHQKKI